MSEHRVRFSQVFKKYYEQCSIDNLDCTLMVKTFVARLIPSAADQTLELVKATRSMTTPEADSQMRSDETRFELSSMIKKILLQNLVMSFELAMPWTFANNNSDDPTIMKNLFRLVPGILEYHNLKEYSLKEMKRPFQQRQLLAESLYLKQTALEHTDMFNRMLCQNAQDPVAFPLHSSFDAITKTVDLSEMEVVCVPDGDTRVVRAMDRVLQRQVVIKFFQTYGACTQVWRYSGAIIIEAQNYKDIWQKLQNCAQTNPTVGFLKVLNEESTNVFLEFESLGCNLGELFLKQAMHTGEWAFSLKTVLMIADQILTRLQTLHSTGFVHVGIKPENFAIGSKEKGEHNLIYIIDMGVSSRYLESDGEHIPNTYDGPVGNRYWRFKHNSNGHSPSRRDDLGSLAYMLSFFLKGGLPWMYKDREKIKEMQNDVSVVQQLFDGYPSEFEQYLKYCEQLDFDEEPDYNYCRGLFRQVHESFQCSDDGLFDWSAECWNSTKSC